MVDKFDKQTRSRMMAAVKNKNTKPEILVRKALFNKGFRYRLHDQKLPGKPDLVFPKYKAVIFINGCFWHGHDCKHGKLPDTNGSFWKEKIDNNKKRDLENINFLHEMGWKTKIIWTCEIKDINKLTINIKKWMINYK